MQRCTQHTKLWGVFLRSLVKSNCPTIYKIQTSNISTFSKYSSHSEISNFNRMYKRLQNSQSRNNSDAIVNLLLGKEYSIPKDLQLQIMSPSLRSFPHKRQFFTKLGVTGKGLLQIQCQMFNMSKSSTSKNLINGLDFLMSGETMDCQRSLKAFVETFGLDNALILPHKTAPDLPRDIKLSSTVYSLFLLIGAVYLQHGPTKTENFIRTCIINGRSGLYRIHTRLDDSPPSPSNLRR